MIIMESSRLDLDNNLIFIVLPFFLVIFKINLKIGKSWSHRLSYMKIINGGQSVTKLLI